MFLMAWVGEKLFKKEALGGGDIKLVAAAGAILGWNGLLGSILLGSIIGSIFGVLLIILHRKNRNEFIPFGPFLCLGVYLTCLRPIFWIRILFP